jgi:hypothetical protein
MSCYRILFDASPRPLIATSYANTLFRADTADARSCLHPGTDLKFPYFFFQRCLTAVISSTSPAIRVLCDANVGNCAFDVLLRARPLALIRWRSMYSRI